MYFILNPELELCGYKGLPFALYNRETKETSFFDKEQYKVVYGCDGKHNLDPNSMSEKQKELFNSLKGMHMIKECEYGTELNKNQQHKMFENYRKTSVHWSITGDCNFRCRHCFMSAPEAKFGIPSTEQLLSLIPEFEKCGIRTIDITGGEPLIRKDFFEIIDSLIEHNLTIRTIYTNGALVTDAFLEAFEKRSLHPDFQLSFDGTNGWHDWLRGIKGAEKMAIDAMDRIIAHKCSFSVALTLHKHNKDDLRTNINLLAKHGCSAMKLSSPYSLGCWVGNEESSLSFEEYMQTILDFIPIYLEDDTPIDLMMESYFMYNKNEGKAVITAERGADDSEFVCAPMSTNVFISPEGNALPCMSMIGMPIASCFPNVYKTSLQEILNDSTYSTAARCKVGDYLKHNPKCSGCSYKYKCVGGCRAKALGSGSMDFLVPEQELCKFFLDGWYDKFTTAINNFNLAIQKKKEKEKKLEAYLAKDF